LEKVQVHPTGLVDPKDPDAKVKFLAAEALRGVGGLLLDNEGNRFADELGHRDYVTGRMWDNNKFPVRLVLNSEATKEIEWHCKHYVGRGLMKRIEGGDALAKEIGIPPSKLKATFDDYIAIANGKKKCLWNKKFFHNYHFKMDDVFHVAVMTPVLHYTMGGVEIDDHSRVLSTDKKPIPGLFASGEVAGGVHGANRLGGSSLLGCVVFGRVAGDSAAAYLLQSIASGSGPAARLGQVRSHLKTIVDVNPENKSVSLTFSWADSPATATNAATGASAAESSPPTMTSKNAGPGAQKKEEPQDKALKEYSAAEVAKHDKKDDCWVIVNGQVLDVTAFKADHPGGAKAIELYAGKDATEEFLMLHDLKVIPKYAPDAVIGTVRK
jgi:cytochrome b involved in lipid metabolism